MDPVRALSLCSGVASARRLQALGVTRHQLQQAVRAHRVQRVPGGGFALPDADQALVAAYRLRGIVSCGTATAAHGLPLLLGPPDLHLTVARNSAHAVLPGVTVHRRDLRPDEHDGVRTALLRTALDCARELPLRDGVVVLDAALQRGLTRADLRAGADRMGGRGSAALRRAVRAVDDGAESPLESCLRLLAAGLGQVASQVHIPGVGRVDLLVDGWLVLEADGFEYHSQRASFRNDLRRANALAELGYRLLRFGHEDVVHRPEHVTATIRALLERGPSR